MVIVIGLLGFIGFIDSAYAYIDPGTGSYVLQVGLALILGAVFTAKTWWLYAKNYVISKVKARRKKLENRLKG